MCSCPECPCRRPSKAPQLDRPHRLVLLVQLGPDADFYVVQRASLFHRTFAVDNAPALLRAPSLNRNFAIDPRRDPIPSRIDRALPVGQDQIPSVE